MNRIIIIVLLSLLITGCQTMSEDECLTADWRSVGYEDGSIGRAAGNIGRHREACAKFGVTPDLESYNRGRADGLGVFCRPSNGFRLGRNGAEYGAVCPQSLELAFQNSYRSGRMIGDSERALNQMIKTLHKLQHRYEEVASILDSEALEDRIISDDSTPEERARLLQHSKELAHELEHLAEEIVHIEHDIGGQEARIKIMLSDSDFL